MMVESDIRQMGRLELLYTCLANLVILQDPSDPDAAYRSKAGKSHKGYCANLIEAIDEKGSMIIDHQYHQYDVDTRSDASFIKEYLENAEVSEETSSHITDGAYAGEEASKLAADKNMDLLTTGLLGRKLKEILSRFELDESGHQI